MALLAVAVIVAVAVSTYRANAGGDGRHPYAIGLWAIFPYSPSRHRRVPNLIADMNSQTLTFTVHDGDLKSGSAMHRHRLHSGLGYLNSLNGAAMFTPGDNDWVDCDRTRGIQLAAQTRQRTQSSSSRPNTLSDSIR